MNLIINWYFRHYFLSAWQPQTLIARIARNHLKVTTNFKLKLEATRSTDVGNYRNRSPGSPRFRYRQDARHWNIIKTKIHFPEIPTHPPVIETKSMLSPFTTVQQQRWTHLMVPKVPVFNCTPPPYVSDGTSDQSQFH